MYTYFQLKFTLQELLYLSKFELSFSAKYLIYSISMQDLTPTIQKYHL